MKRLWRGALLPLLLLPGAAVTTVAQAAPAHAAVTCNPLALKARIETTASLEITTFVVTNCRTRTETVILSGRRIAPETCPGSGLDFGDSPPFSIPAAGVLKIQHTAPAPTCKGNYTVKGESELGQKEIVLGKAGATYALG